MTSQSKLLAGSNHNKEESCFKCTFCTKVFSTFKSKIKHEYDCKTDKCPVCSKWMKKRNIQRHVMTVYVPENEPFPCEKVFLLSNWSEKILPLFSKSA